MLHLLVRWLVTSLTVLMLPALIDGIRVDTYGAALACAAVLSALNLFVKPVLVFLTFPFLIVSLGLFLLIINAVLFYWAGILVTGIYVSSFGSAFFASLILSGVSMVLQMAHRRDKRRVTFIRPVVRYRNNQRQMVDLN